MSMPAYDRLGFLKGFLKGGQHFHFYFVGLKVSEIFNFIAILLKLRVVRDVLSFRNIKMFIITFRMFRIICLLVIVTLVFFLPCDEFKVVVYSKHAMICIAA